MSEQAVILIIDDLAENRQLLSRQLGAHSYRVLTAETGAQGLETACRELPDLILLDVMIPDLDGYELCRRLKGDSRTAGIPVIMVTALREIAYRLRGIEAGADEFISRPHHLEELLLRVRSLVQLKRARQRLEAERNSLQLLYEVSRAVSTKLELDALIRTVLQLTQSALGATKGSLILTNPFGHVQHKVIIRASTGLGVGDGVAQQVLQDGFAGWLLRHRRGAIIDDTTADPRWVQLRNDADPAGSAIGTPLGGATDDVLGLLILTHPQPHAFQPHHLELLDAIAGQVSGALRNAQLFNAVDEERRKLGAVLAMSNEAIVLLDDQFQVLLFNHAAELLFDVDAAAVIGRSARLLRPFEPLLEIAATGRPANEEVLLDDGRILAVSLSPIAGVGSLAVVQDITERTLAEARRLERERREKEALREMFSRYVSPSLLEHALGIGNVSDLFRHRRRWAVILFADLRNHTQMVSTLPSDQALELLNEFFDNMTEIIHRFEGTIVDLIGDELEVGFNVPLDQPDAAQRALRTAIEMQRRFNQLRPRWFKRAGAELGLGIGIDQGDVVIGNVGSPQRMNLAMVGEAVNTAHRLVDLAEDGQIVISADYHALIAPELGRYPVRFESLGRISLKGLTKPLGIYRAQMRRTRLHASATTRPTMGA